MINRINRTWLHAVGRGALGVAALALAATALAEYPSPMYRPPTPEVGGLSPHPFISGSSLTETGMVLTVDGISFQHQVLVSSNLTGAPRIPVGDPVARGESVTVPTDGEMGIITVQAPNPNYIGSDACAFCHSGVHDDYATTAHARAFETLESIGQHKNSRCLACHTVGYGYPNGYVDELSTPHLKDVGCENCHGPAANHISNPFVNKPVVTLASETCGGCHTGFHHPTYDEWTESRHFHIDEHVQEYFLDPTSGVSRMKSCGACHSGAARMAMLSAAEEGVDPVFPTGEDAAYFSVTCSVCHNAHQNTLGSQTRNPTYSTNHFSYSTSTSTDFAAQYNPDVQLCGQCHNMRGAKWTDTSRPPHHSTQYNIVVGTGGFEPGTNDVQIIATHGRDIAKQCAHCHTHFHDPGEPDEENPVYTGHEFRPVIADHTCAADGCHGSGTQAELFTEATQMETKRQIGELKELLDEWGMTKSEQPLRDKYGALAWEYSNAGQVSAPDGGVSGPSSSEQSLVPDAIKQARYNLYLVEHDASYGVHNGRYARHLLSVAKTNVLTLLKAE